MGFSLDDYAKKKKQETQKKKGGFSLDEYAKQKNGVAKAEEESAKPALSSPAIPVNRHADEVKAVGERLIADGGVNALAQAVARQEAAEKSELENRILRAEKDVSASRQNALGAMTDDYLATSRGRGFGFLTDPGKRTDEAVGAYQKDVQDLLDTYADARLQNRADLAKAEAERDMQMRIAADESWRPKSAVESMRQNAQEMQKADWSGTNTAHVAPYLMNEVAQGAAGQVWNAGNLITQPLADLFTKGEASNSMQKIQTYLNENPEAHNTLLNYYLEGTPGREGILMMMAERAGVNNRDMNAYVQNNLANLDRAKMQSTWEISEGVRNLGDMAYSVGQQIPSIMLTAAGGSPAVTKAISSALMGMSSAGAKLQQNAQQYGFDWLNYANAVATGLTEFATEALGNTPTLEAISGMTFAQNSIGEMMEELIGYPVGQIVDWLTLKDGARDGAELKDIFDMNEWLKAGVNGLIVGGVLGSFGKVANIAGRAMDGKISAQQAATELNKVVATLPDGTTIDALDPRVAKMEDVRKYSERILDSVVAQIEQAKAQPKMGAEIATEMGIGKNGAEVAQQAGITPENIGAFTAYYDAGSDGKAFEEVRTNQTGIDENTARQAFNAGQMDAMQADLDKGQQAAYNEMKQEAADNGTGENDLRQGGKWYDGQNSGQPVSELEKGAGRDQSGNLQAGYGQSKIDGLEYSEREVSSREAGLEDGFDDDRIRLVTGGTNQTYLDAKAEAESLGLELVAFVGGDIHTKEAPDGARGVVVNGKLYARMDDPEFSGYQIARHEGGHELIRSGVINVKKTLDAVAKKMGGNFVQRMTDLYVSAYAGTNLTDEQIEAEMVCDARGDMNIFASYRDVLAEAAELADVVLPKIREEARSGGGTRAGPEGAQYSRRAQRGRTIELETMENNRFERLRSKRDSLPKEWFAYTKDFFYIYSNHSFVEYSILAKISITEANRNAIAQFEEDVENGAYSDARVYDSWVQNFRRGKGRYSWTSVDAGQHRAAARHDGMDGRERGSKDAGNSQRGGKNPQQDAAVNKADKNANYSRRLDADYLRAVQNRDLETAQRMVDEAAKAAGYLIDAYHGTDADFWKFSLKNRGRNGEMLGVGYYFTADEKKAEMYSNHSGKTKHVYLDIRKPIDYKSLSITPEEWGAFLDYAEQHVDEYIEGVWKGNALNKDFKLRYLTEFDNDAELIKTFIDTTAGRNATVAEGYLKMLKDSIGYDGVNYQNGDAKVYVAFTPEQIKAADAVTYDENGDIIPLSERFNPENEDIRWSRRLDTERVRKALDEYVEKYGAIEPGEKAAREIQVPRKTGETENVSKTVRTILEAGATPEAAIPTIEQMVANGELSYETISDKQAIANAQAKLTTKGWSKTLSKWLDEAKAGTVSKDHTVTGWALYNNAANAGDLDTAMTVLEEMVKSQRNAAQALQATRVLKKLSPEAQLYAAQRSVEDLQEEINERYGSEKAPQISIDLALAEAFLSAKTEDARTAAMAELYKDIGRQMPSTFRDKWNAWRYLAMLGNPRTHVRNIVGNAGFAPVVAAKNLTATAIEKAVHVVSGGNTGRSKAIIGTGKADRAILKAAWGDYAKVQDQIMSGGKYSDFQLASQAIEEGRRIFKTKALEAARRGNTRAMEAEDAWFSKPHYAYALAGYCKANGITPEMIEKGVSIETARAYAIREAQKATYRDTNAFSQTISELGKVNKNEKNIVKKGVGVVLQGILPFRKTPANILVRGVEYSPIGLMKAISADAYKVAKGDMSATEMIDNLSAGLTGTGLLAMGAFFAAQGLIRGHGPDDEKKEFEEMQGHQAYSLEIGDTSVTLDWLAPECLPFFVGVNLYEQSVAEGEDVSMSTMLSAIQNVSEPMLEMSCLQSLNDVFDAVGYASSNDLAALPSILASAATSYLTQGLPTLLGQAERSGQDVRYTTYTTKDSFLTSDMQYTLGSASARIPGWDFQQIPYIDAWGRQESSGGIAGRSFDNFLNPSYTSTITGSGMEDELMRLYDETGEGSVFPTRAQRSFPVGGDTKYLTADEYVKYATQKGQISYELVNALQSFSAYNGMSDEEKVDAVSDAYQLANVVAKHAVSNYTTTGWMEKAVAANKKAGISYAKYLEVRINVSNIESIKDKDGESITNSKGLQIMEAIYNIKGLNDKQRKQLFEDFGVGKTIIDLNKAAVEAKLKNMR